jgi:hypothetical protein
MFLKRSDTDPRAEECRISPIRRAIVAEQIARTRSLSRSVIWLSRRAIDRAHPESNGQEKNLIFIEQCYGDELADRLRIILPKRPDRELDS